MVACQADERVVAAFLGGSYAKGMADLYSDLDLYLVTTDQAYDAFLAEREAMIQRLGEPLFLEDFGIPNLLLYVLVDGTEGELWIGRENHFRHLAAGSHCVLIDKHGLLVDAVFPDEEADPAKQREVLRQQINQFWHDLSHFVKAMRRGQLWFGYGELEILRRMCVNLARLAHNFGDRAVGEEPYFKIEQAVPIERLSPLRTTYCPMEYGAMLRAASVIVHFYLDVAPTLARAHGIPYPVALERLLLDQLEGLSN